MGDAGLSQKKVIKIKNVQFPFIKKNCTPHNSNNMASVVKQGTLLFYDVKASQWKETDVKLLKNSVFEYTIGGVSNAAC
jgi:hypothetical protein